MSVQPTFTGEVQFRRYSDTSTQGVQIVLALHDREALEPLVHLTGKRFMAVLVEIGDDEKPVQPPAKAPVKVGPLCREAVSLCEMLEFQDWAARYTSDGVRSVSNTKAWMCSVIGIDSRKELDADPIKADLFVKMIRLPFMKHMKTRQAA